MIVCVCHRVSDRDIEREVRHGCHSFDELQDETRVGTACGSCLECARDTFEVTRACRPEAGVPMQARHPAAHAAGGEMRVIPVSDISRSSLAA